MTTETKEQAKTFTIMKIQKEKWMLAALAGAGAAAIAYKVLLRNGIPDDAIVQDFDKDRYLGKWNEIARLPSSLEKNLKAVSDEYQMNDDGTIKVITKAFNTKKHKWIDLEGKMKFDGPENEAKFRISYFGPVYFAYNVLAVDDDYKHALVSSGNMKYLWVMSRDKTIPDDVKNNFLQKARGIGFETEKLEWV